MKSLTFDTYPDMFSDYENCIENENYDNEMRMFVVPEDWAINWILENTEWNMAEFWEEYTWDETLVMYEKALSDKVILREYIEER